MKPAHPVLKIATLFVFVALISGFVAYRTGAFNGVMYGERIAVNMDHAAVDSPGTDSVKPAPVMMSSSKSVYVPDNHPASTDADKAENKKRAKPANANNEPIIMPSSKSGAIFIPEPDTTKEAPQQQQQQQKPKK
jgi:hypothetical protein